MKKLPLGVSLTAMAAANLTLASGVSAQEAPSAESGRVDTITVSAQRREQNQQDVPIAITTQSNETLIRTGTDTLSDLTAITPGLTGRNQGLFPGIYSIRGINSNSFGVGGDNSVGVFVDNVFIGRQSISNIGFLDVDRIEVLKGPQGTLFGRNSTAGVISITSKKPGDEFEGEGRISYGNLNSLDAFAAVSIPVIQDKFALRVAGQRRREDGAWTNVATGERIGDQELWSGKVSAVWNVTDNFTARGFYALWREETTGYPWGATDESLTSLVPGSSPDPFDRLVATNVDQFEERDADVAGLTLNYDISDNISITSITAYTKLQDQGFTDLDGSILPLFQANFGPDASAIAANPGFSGGTPNETFSQELRLTGSNDRIDWLLGVNYFAEWVGEPITFQFDDTFFVGGTPIDAGTFFPGSPAFAVCDATSDALLGPCNTEARESVLQDGDYDSFAVYGDLRYAVTGALALTVGLRYSYDEKEFAFSTFIEPNVTSILSGSTIVFPDTMGAPVILKDDWSDFQPRFVIDYQWNDEILTYASVSRGFKAGGFDISQSADDIPFDEESVWAYEVGLKSTLASGRAVLNLAGYFNDYEGLQVQTVVNGITQTVNIPTLDNYGFELEMLAKPSDSLDFNMGVAFNESEFGTFVTDAGDLTGNRVPQTSRWQLNFGAQYTHSLTSDLDVYLRGDANYRTREFETIENVDAFSQEGYWLGNARLALANADGRWELALFARNIFDAEYVSLRNNLGFGTVAIAAPPRRWGGEIRASF
ncbi:MAG: TonB-dependent receptor [Pseudomonadota bacterium]